MAQTTVPRDIRFYLFIKIYFQSKNIKRTQLSQPIAILYNKNMKHSISIKVHNHLFFKALWHICPSLVCSACWFATMSYLLTFVILCVYACYIKSLIQRYLGNTTFWSKKCLVFWLLLGFLFFCFFGGSEDILLFFFLCLLSSVSLINKWCQGGWEVVDSRRRNGNTSSCTLARTMDKEKSVWH